MPTGHEHDKQSRHRPFRPQVCDLRRLTAAAHEAGALVVVDNSIMTFMYQRPLDLGADISMTSATKFIGGHSDVMAGLLSVRDEELAQRIYFHQVSNPERQALEGLNWGYEVVCRLPDDGGSIRPAHDAHRRVWEDHGLVLPLTRTGSWRRASTMKLCPHLYHHDDRCVPPLPPPTHPNHPPTNTYKPTPASFKN